MAVVSEAAAPSGTASASEVTAAKAAMTASSNGSVSRKTHKKGHASGEAVSSSSASSSTSGSPSNTHSTANGSSKQASANSDAAVAASSTATQNGPPYICSTCQTSYSRLEYLRRHERRHADIRPFACECGKSFSRSDVLSRHKRQCAVALGGEPVETPPKEVKPRKNSIKSRKPSASSANTSVAAAVEVDDADTRGGEDGMAAAAAALVGVSSSASMPPTLPTSRDASPNDVGRFDGLVAAKTMSSAGGGFPPPPPHLNHHAAATSAAAAAEAAAANTIGGILPPPPYAGNGGSAGLPLAGAAPGDMSGSLNGVSGPQQPPHPYGAAGLSQPVHAQVSAINAFVQQGLYPSSPESSGSLHSQTSSPRFAPRDMARVGSGQGRFSLRKPPGFSYSQDFWEALDPAAKQLSLAGPIGSASLGGSQGSASTAQGGAGMRHGSISSSYPSHEMMRSNSRSSSMGGPAGTTAGVGMPWNMPAGSSSASSSVAAAAAAAVAAAAASPFAYGSGSSTGDLASTTGASSGLDGNASRNSDFYSSGAHASTSSIPAAPHHLGPLPPRGEPQRFSMPTGPLSPFSSIALSSSMSPYLNAFSNARDTPLTASPSKGAMPGTLTPGGSSSSLNIFDWTMRAPVKTPTGGVGSGSVTGQGAKDGTSAGHSSQNATPSNSASKKAGAKRKFEADTNGSGDEDGKAGNSNGNGKRISPASAQTSFHDTGPSVKEEIAMDHRSAAELLDSLRTVGASRAAVDGTTATSASAPTMSEPMPDAKQEQSPPPTDAKPGDAVLADQGPISAGSTAEQQASTTGLRGGANGASVHADGSQKATPYSDATLSATASIPGVLAPDGQKRGGCGGQDSGGGPGRGGGGSGCGGAGVLASATIGMEDSLAERPVVGPKRHEEDSMAGTKASGAPAFARPEQPQQAPPMPRGPAYMAPSPAAEAFLLRSQGGVQELNAGLLAGEARTAAMASSAPPNAASALASSAGGANAALAPTPQGVWEQLGLGGTSTPTSVPSSTAGAAPASGWLLSPSLQQLLTSLGDVVGRPGEGGSYFAGAMAEGGPAMPQHTGPSPAPTAVPQAPVNPSSPAFGPASFAAQTAYYINKLGPAGPAFSALASLLSAPSNESKMGAAPAGAAASLPVAPFFGTGGDAQQSLAAYMSLASAAASMPTAGNGAPMSALDVLDGPPTDLGSTPGSASSAAAHEALMTGGLDAALAASAAAASAGVRNNEGGHGFAGFEAATAAYSIDPALERALNDVRNPFYIPPQMFRACYSISHWKLPPLTRLSMLALHAQSNLLKHMPIIHEPTFRLDTTPGCLAFTVCMLGCHEAGRKWWAGEETVPRPIQALGPSWGGPVEGSTDDFLSSLGLGGGDASKPHLDELDGQPLVRPLVMTEKMDMLVRSFVSRAKTEKDQVSVVQALMLFQSNNFLSSDPTIRAVAAVSHGSVVTLARKAGFYNPGACHSQREVMYSPDDVMRTTMTEAGDLCFGHSFLPNYMPSCPDEEKLWRRWSDLAGRRRTAFLILIMDTVATLDAGLPTQLTLEEVAHLPLPSPDTIWRAPTASAWRKELEKYRGPTFGESISGLLRGGRGADGDDSDGEVDVKATAATKRKRGMPPPCTPVYGLHGPFARLVMVIALLRGIIHLVEARSRQVARPSPLQPWLRHVALLQQVNGTRKSSPNSTLPPRSTFDAEVHVYHRALRRWRKAWDADDLSNGRGRQHLSGNASAVFTARTASGATPLCDDALPFYWLCRALLQYAAPHVQSSAKLPESSLPESLMAAMAASAPSSPRNQSASLVGTGSTNKAAPAQARSPDFRTLLRLAKIFVTEGERATSGGPGSAAATPGFNVDAKPPNAPSRANARARAASTALAPGSAGLATTGTDGGGVSGGASKKRRRTASTSAAVSSAPSGSAVPTGGSNATAAAAAAAAASAGTSKSGGSRSGKTASGTGTVAASA